MFEVNNKNTRTTSLTASSFSIFEFEQVNISWKYEEYNTNHYAAGTESTKNTT